MWKTWKEIRNLTKNRDIVFYGRSEDWIPRSVPHISAKFIVDSNKTLHESYYYDMKVCDPKLLNVEDKPFVVITTGDYINISEYLESIGYIPGNDFCPCPEYYDFKNLDDLRSIKFKCLISSSDYTSGKATRTSYYGGGIFELINNGIEPELIKKTDGQFRQLITKKDCFAAIEYTKSELQWFDYNHNIIDVFPLNHYQCCGLDQDSDKNIYISSSSTDIIYIYDEKGKELDQINFGTKSNEKASSFHHINDLCVDDSYIYISFFSNSGHWRQNIFDGGVKAIDKKTGHQELLYQGLWQPHSPRLINGNLYIADSANGRLLKDTINSTGEFPGFIRGLDYKDDLVFLGQSETMYTSRKKGLSKNIMNNSGLYIFDEESKASRFFSTYGICNIHDLRVIEL